jgi:hypothetical protein
VSLSIYGELDGIDLTGIERNSSNDRTGLLTSEQQDQDFRPSWKTCIQDVINLWKNKTPGKSEGKKDPLVRLDDGYMYQLSRRHTRHCILHESSEA